MSKRSKRFLTFLLYAAIVSSFGCTTNTHTSIRPTKTTQVVEPSEAVVNIFDSVTFEESPNSVCEVYWRVRVATAQFGNISEGRAPLFSITP